jgi:hypothetical protein
MRLFSAWRYYSTVSFREQFKLDWMPIQAIKKTPRFSTGKCYRVRTEHDLRMLTCTDSMKIGVLSLYNCLLASFETGAFVHGFTASSKWKHMCIIAVHNRLNKGSIFSLSVVLLAATAEVDLTFFSAALTYANDRRVIKSCSSDK